MANFRSNKRRIEESKKKKREEKRLKRLNKNEDLPSATPLETGLLPDTGGDTTA